jgi:hypothetical protein
LLLVVVDSCLFLFNLRWGLAYVLYLTLFLLVGDPCASSSGSSLQPRLCKRVGGGAAALRAGTEYGWFWVVLGFAPTK